LSKGHLGESKIKVVLAEVAFKTSEYCLQYMSNVITLHLFNDRLTLRKKNNT